MPPSREELREQFVRLASDLASDEASQEDVGLAFLDSFAQYATFVTLNQERAGTALPRKEVFDMLVRLFEDALTRYLNRFPPVEVQSPMDVGALAAEDTGLSDIAEVFLPSVKHVDIALVGYLRGQGHEGLADALVWREKERASRDGDVEYARRIESAMDRGELPKPLALHVVVRCLYPRLMREMVEIGDPIIYDEARQEHVDFYARHGLHTLSKLVQTDPADFFKSENEGARLLHGVAYEQFGEALTERELKKAH